MFVVQSLQSQRFNRTVLSLPKIYFIVCSTGQDTYSSSGTVSATLLIHTTKIHLYKHVYIYIYVISNKILVDLKCIKRICNKNNT